MMMIDNDADQIGDDYDNHVAGVPRSLWLPGHPLLAARWRDCHLLPGWLPPIFFP